LFLSWLWLQSFFLVGNIIFGAACVFVFLTARGYDVGWGDVYVYIASHFEGNWRPNLGLVASIFYFAYPLISICALLLYWRSRKRFRLLPHHLLRAGVYSWVSAAVWIVTIVLTVHGVIELIETFQSAQGNFPIRQYGPIQSRPLPPMWQKWLVDASCPFQLRDLLGWLPVFVVWFWVSLWVSGRRYLCLRKGWTLALAAAQSLTLVFFVTATLLLMMIKPTWLARPLAPLHLWVGW
jgi:hypothetical protein